MDMEKASNKSERVTEKKPNKGKTLSIDDTK